MVVFVKLAVAGAGYVGLSLATLLSQDNEVFAFDLNEKKVNMINKRISPIRDNYIEEYFKNKSLNLIATSDYKEAFSDAEFIIVCTPTDYNENNGFFDTSSVEDIIKKVIDMNIYTTIIIKSTVPIGFVNDMRTKYSTNNIIFSPEFLREGKALYDNLYPSRIIIGDTGDKAHKFAELLKKASLDENVVIKYMNSTEAEAVKFFSNSYLAMRIAYFNELDTYAEMNNLNVRDIIDGVCLDPRIGDYYNNPSFGYGGYCLPKDTKQLLASYEDIPQSIIKAIVKSNEVRKEYIANRVLQSSPKIVGIYRLTMKTDSDNFRSSAILDIIEKLKKNDVKIVIYEPTLNQKVYCDCEVIESFDRFLNISEVVLANRINTKINNIDNVVYTRDVFNRD